jgi:hypothetical protein
MLIFFLPQSLPCGKLYLLYKALLHTLLWWLKESHDANCATISALAKLDQLLVYGQSPECPKIGAKLKARDWILRHLHPSPSV